MSYTRLSHPASDSISPLSKGSNMLSAALPMLGPPAAPLPINVEDRLAHEQWGYEKMFENRSWYLENSVSTQAMKTNNPFMTNVIMPLKYYDQINFKWTKWYGHRTLVPRSPQGAPSENVTQSREVFSAKMNRYQLGFTVNAETLSTTEGQFALALDLATVAVAFGDTFEQLGLMALLTRKHYHRERLRRMSAPFANAVEVFAYEKLFWDCIRKDPKGLGWNMLVEEVKKAMRDMLPTAAIIPEGLKSLLITGPANQEYYLHGPGARRNVEFGSDVFNGGVAIGGITPFVVREIELGREGVRVRPMHRVRTIGDHFRLDDFASDCRPEEYRSCSRNIKVFNMAEPRGEFTIVDFMTALSHTERFAPDGTLSEKHTQLAADPISKAHRLGLNLDGDFVDMFLYHEGSTYFKCDVLGHMEEKALPYAELRATAETVIVRLLETEPRVRTELVAGKKLLDKMFATQLKDREIATLSKVAMSAGNEFGAHDLDSIDPDTLDESGSYLPPGFGSVAGLYTIAAVDPSSKLGRSIGAETLKTASAFTEAVDTVHRVMSSIFSTDHPVLSGSTVPAHFESGYAKGSTAQKEMHGKIAMAQTLFDSNKAPLHFHGASVASRGGAGGNAAAPELLEPLAGTIGDDADDAEKLVINAVRARLATSASPAVRAAFATSASVRQFREAYSASPLAMAFKRFSMSKFDNAADKQAVNTTSFGLFANTHLNDALAGSAQSLANLMHNVVEAVNSSENISARGFDGKLASWATSAPTFASSSAQAIPASGSVRTRLVVSPEALARSKTTMFSFGDANVNVDQHSFENAFAHSAAGPPSFERVNRAATAPGSYFAKETTNIVNRHNKINKDEIDPLMKLVMRLLLVSPITMQTFARFFTNDVRIPVAILGERPLRRYETASVLFVAPGEPLGELAWSNYGIYLSANAQTHQLSGNCSIYAIAIIKDESRSFLAEDVLVTGYHGGESLEAFTSEFDPADLTNTTASVFYLLVPIGSLRGPEMVSKTHDVRGYYRADIVENRLSDAARRLVINKPHYATALYYNGVFAWNGLRVLSLMESEYFKVDGRSDNTVTHQTMQWMWSPKTGEHSKAILNTDHFGINIAEGHGDLRTMGAAAMYKECNYASIAPVG